jgi:hypothetical protein
MKKLLSSVAVATFVAGMAIGTPAAAAIGVGDDPVLYWNTVMLVGLPAGPPIQAREAAMVNAAMFDAVNATTGSNYNPYISGNSASGGDTRAAASQAAHDVLVALNPANAAAYNAALASSLALVSDPAARAAGVATGASYAAAIIANRSADGAAGAGAIPYTAGTNPGDWQLTSATPPVLPGWGAVTPFLMSSGDQFRPGAPPALDSVAYAQAYNNVMAIGSATSATRTADQTNAALFWAAAGGASWVQLALNIAGDNGLSTIENAQLFALLTTSVSDAFVAVYDAKYTYDFWRPVTAIHAGDTDGNPLTAGDPNWTSLLAAPNHPSYFSAHASADGAAAAILLGLLGDESFCGTFGGFTRCWSSIEAASQEGADSRIWGGIHLAFDGSNGLQTGGLIGQYALNQSRFQAVPEPSTWAMMLIGFGLVGFSLRRRRGERPKPIPQLA